MGVGSSGCKGSTPNGQDDDPRSRKGHGMLDADGVPRPISTAMRNPLLPAFEDREPFEPSRVLIDRDSSLLKALTHHRTPFAVLNMETGNLEVVYASGGWVAAMLMPVEQIEGTALAGVLKKGIKAAEADIQRLESTIVAREDTSLIVKGATGKKNAKVIPYTQFFATPVEDDSGQVLYSFLSLQPVSGPEAEPSQTMPYRFRRAWQCLKPSTVWSLFTPYKKLCETDAGLVTALQDRREMFCITDPDLYDNPIVFVSDDFVDMTGYNREEINGINCRFLQGEMTSQEDVEVIRYGIREQTDMRVCLLNYRKNGTAFLNQFNLSPLRDVSGRLAFFIGVQIEVEDAEVLPFPTTRQTLQELLVDEEEKDFWDDAELAPAQESATTETASHEREMFVNETSETSADMKFEGAKGEMKVSEGASKLQEEKLGSDGDPMEG